MSFLKALDLYKGIVLLMTLLLPVAGGWVYWLQGQIDDTKRSLSTSRAQIEEVGLLQRQMETVINNRNRAQQAQDHVVYFDQILFSATSAGINKDDFEISRLNEVKHSLGRNQRVADQEVTITFGKTRSDFPLPRDYIFAVLYNGELQIWKLRSIDMVNATDERTFAQHKTPVSPELEDKWIVRNLKFVRRQPDKER